MLSAHQGAIYPRAVSHVELAEYLKKKGEGETKKRR